jgi:hypothetical protein
LSIAFPPITTQPPVGPVKSSPSILTRIIADLEAPHRSEEIVLHCPPKPLPP